MHPLMQTKQYWQGLLQCQSDLLWSCRINHRIATSPFLGRDLPNYRGQYDGCVVRMPWKGNLQLGRVSQQIVNIDQYIALDRGASITLLIPSSGAATSCSPSHMESTSPPTLYFSCNLTFGVSTVVDGDNLTSPYDTLVTRKWMFIDPGSSSVEEMIQSTHTFPINVQQ